MRNILVLSAILLTSPVQAGIIGMLATDQLGQTLDVYGYMHAGRPAMILVLGKNPEQCRPPFGLAVFGPSVVVSGRQARISFFIGDPSARGGATLCGPKYVQELAGGPATAHGLKEIVLLLADHDREIADLLVRDPDILDSDRVEYEVAYQHFAPGSYDAEMKSFFVSQRRLVSEALPIHRSPR